MLCIAFYITLLFGLIAYMSKDKGTDKILYTFVVLFLIVFSALRDPFVYPDNINYYDFFNGDYSSADVGTVNVGYKLLNSVINYVLPYFQVLCIVLSIVIINSYAKLNTKYSPYPWLGLLLFVFINYYSQFFLLRQFAAMPFIFLSLEYIIKRDQKKYWLCILLAISMHTTAIIFTPMYYLYGIKYSKRNMFLILIATVSSAILFPLLGGFVSSYLIYYATYFNMDEVDPAWQRALIKVAIAAIYIYALGKEIYKEGVNRIIFYCMLMNIIICIGAMNIFGVFRLREFFSIADIIGVPIIFYYSKQSRGLKRVVIFLGACIYLVLIYISFKAFIEGGNMENNYRFFWEGVVGEKTMS